MTRLQKISIFAFAFSILLMLHNPVSAAEKKITNSNGIKMTEEQYGNLKELGFTDLAINQMNKDVFKENKDLVVDSKTEVTKYYEIKEKPQAIQNFSLTDEENGNYISTELSKEEYFDRVQASKNYFPTLSDDTTQTSYRRLTTSIQLIGSDTRLYNQFVWDTIPTTRSYDVLGASIDSTFTPVSGSNYGQQLWSYTNPTTGGFYGDNASYSSNSSTWSKTSAGYGVKMNLKDDASNLRVTELEGYAYYKIARSSSVVPYYINAYGNYSHAKTNVSSTFGFGFSFGGPAISWSGITSTSFDTITTHAQTKY
jgi:hypothetical protein